MNPTFEITDESVNKKYKVTTDTTIATGSISVQQGEVKQISGTVFTKNAEGAQGDYIANFNGQKRGEEMKYSFSEMNHEQSVAAWEVIETIEENIIENEETE